MPSQRTKEVKRVRDAFAGAIEQLTALEADRSIEEGKIKDIFCSAFAIPPRQKL